MAIAIVAHILVWSWRPWLPGPNGYRTSLLDGVDQAIHTVTALLA